MKTCGEIMNQILHKTTQIMNLYMVLMATISDDGPQTEAWFLDTMCSKHMTVIKID
jgi:hypothetical protein